MISLSIGFYTTRLLAALGTEFISLLLEYQNPLLIETFFLHLGFPLGFLDLCDQVTFTSVFSPSTSLPFFTSLSSYSIHFLSAHCSSFLFGPNNLPNRSPSSLSHFIFFHFLFCTLSWIIPNYPNPLSTISIFLSPQVGSNVFFSVMKNLNQHFPVRMNISAALLDDMTAKEVSFKRVRKVLFLSLSISLFFSLLVIECPKQGRFANFLRARKELDPEVSAIISKHRFGVFSHSFCLFAVLFCFVALTIRNVLIASRGKQNRIRQCYSYPIFSNHSSVSNRQ